MKIANKNATKCANCGAVGTQSCARCRKVCYCSQTCQKQDWKFQHKQVCANPHWDALRSSMDPGAMYRRDHS